jgi:hypothetical protein
MSQPRSPHPSMGAELSEFEVEEFEYSEYARCSDNNMPCYVTFVPLSSDEQAEAEIALAEPQEGLESIAFWVATSDRECIRGRPFF